MARVITQGSPPVAQRSFSNAVTVLVTNWVLNRALIGCRLPDRNPIEKLCSNVEALLRSAKARTEEALLTAIAVALEAVCSSDARG